MQKLEDSRAELKKRELSLEESKTLLQKLEARLLEKSAELDESRNSSASMKNTLESMKKDMDIQNKALKKADMDLKETKSEMQTHRNKVTELRRRLYELNIEIKDKEEIINKAKAAFDVDYAPKSISSQTKSIKKPSSIRKSQRKQQKGEKRTVRFQVDQNLSMGKAHDEPENENDDFAIQATKNQKLTEEDLKDKYPSSDDNHTMGSIHDANHGTCLIPDFTQQDDSGSDKEAEEAAPASLRSDNIHDTSNARIRMFSRRNISSPRQHNFGVPPYMDGVDLISDSINNTEPRSDIKALAKATLGVRLRKRKSKNGMLEEPLESLSKQQKSASLFGGLFNLQNLSPNKESMSLPHQQTTQVH